MKSKSWRFLWDLLIALLLFNNVGECDAVPWATPEQQKQQKQLEEHAKLLGLEQSAEADVTKPLDGPKRPQRGVSLKYVRASAVDADTIDLVIEVPIRVRLLDCWAPESRSKDLKQKAKGIAATKFTKGLIDGKDGQFFIPTDTATSLKDILTLNRILAYVWAGEDKVSVNQQVVRAGHASTTSSGELGK